MGDFQTEKALVLELYKALDTAPAGAHQEAMAGLVSDGYLWRGFHPFNELKGVESVAEQFWAPLHTSLTSLQRRLDIFLAGDNRIEGHGRLGGLDGTPHGPVRHRLAGIPPTGKIATSLRRVPPRYWRQDHRNGDVFRHSHLMMQAGLNLPHRQAHISCSRSDDHRWPLFGAQPADEGERTLAAIDAMISDLGQWDGACPLRMNCALPGRRHGLVGAGRHRRHLHHRTI